MPRKTTKRSTAVTKRRPTRRTQQGAGLSKVLKKLATHPAVRKLAANLAEEASKKAVRKIRGQGLNLAGSGLYLPGQGCNRRKPCKKRRVKKKR